MTRFVSFVAIALALLPSVAAAQQPPDSIQPGVRVRVWTSPAAKPVTGMVLSLEGNMLTLLGDKSGTPMGVSRDSISQLDVSGGRRSHGKSILNGLLVGVGSAMVMGLISGGDPEGSFFELSAFEKGLLYNILTVPAGVLIGAIAGPGPERWTTTSGRLTQVGAAPAPSLRFSLRF